MLLALLLSVEIWAQSTTSQCGVRVDLPHPFRQEHLDRFRNHGFSVNGLGTQNIYVEGVLAPGGVRLGRLIIYRAIRGERVEIGRVSAQFLNGLPSQMIARSIPIIQSACSQSLVSEDRDLCPMNLPRIKEERVFTRSALECDIIRFSRSVDDECKAQGFPFCMTELSEYEEDTTQTTSFRGRNCRVKIKGTKYFSIEESRLQKCEILNECRLEITSNQLLNTGTRQERLQREMEFNRCDSPDVNASDVNQSDRDSSTEKTTSPSTQSQPSVIVQ